MKYLPVEVKICEGCGALWLRSGAGDGVYCMHCSARLASFPAACGKRPGGRPVTAKPRQARLKGCARSAAPKPAAPRTAAPRTSTRRSAAGSR